MKIPSHLSRAAKTEARAYADVLRKYNNRVPFLFRKLSALVAADPVGAANRSADFIAKRNAAIREFVRPFVLERRLEMLYSGRPVVLGGVTLTRAVMESQMIRMGCCDIGIQIEDYLSPSQWDCPVRNAD